MTEGTAPPRPGVGSYRRVELLTDAVFAIVMTLLVLEIAIPEGPAAELGDELTALVPTLLTYALTFITIGTLWFGNRTQGEYLERADHPLVWLTLLMLGILALVPFSAGLLGRYPTTELAVVVYGIHLTVVFAVHGCLWLYASLHPWLLRPGLPAGYLRRARVWSFFPAFGYALFTIVGAFAPVAGLIGFLVVPIPFVAGLYYRGLAHLQTVESRG